MNPAVLVLVLGALAWPYRRLRRSAVARLAGTHTSPASHAHVPRRHLVRRRSDRMRREAALPDAIELTVLALRAGALPSAAIGAVAPHVGAALSPSFDAVHRAVLGGQRFADAVQLLPDAIGPTAVAFADSLAAADRDGLPLAPVLERLAAEARLQRRRQADTLARQLPVRLSLPLVLCTLPSFVLLAVAPLLLAALSSMHR